MQRPVLLVLALALSAQVALGAIADKYGVCPKYTVKQGDILFDIAQELGVPQAAIEAAGRACGLDLANLQIGQDLCLPGYIPSRCQHVLQTDPDRPWCQVYTVQEGDSEREIAERFGLTEKELTKLNSDYLKGEKPKPGQYLRLKGWDQVDCRDFNDNDTPKCQMYTVVQGDTGENIARLYKVNVAEMLALNNLTADSPLPINTRIKLPKWDATCTADGVPAVLPADTVLCRVTRLNMNENLSVLAQKYGTTVKALQDANPALQNGTLLQPGAYINVAPFGPDCVGNGKLVDVPGASEVPADFTYNGLVAGAALPTPTTAPGPATAPVVEPEAAPSTDSAMAPSPATAPVEEAAPEVEAPVAEVPAPTATPPSAASLAATASTLLAAVLALAAAAVL